MFCSACRQRPATLKTLEIQTVFDPASSRIFANAAMLLEAGTDPRTMLARYGVPPSDAIRLLPAGVSIDQRHFQDIDITEGIGATADLKRLKYSAAVASYCIP